MTTQELISARSSEANLGQEEFAWLLFGIHDKTHAVLGSSYKPTRDRKSTRLNSSHD